MKIKQIDVKYTTWDRLEVDSEMSEQEIVDYINKNKQYPDNRQMEIINCYNVGDEEIIEAHLVD